MQIHIAYLECVVIHEMKTSLDLGNDSGADSVCVLSPSLGEGRLLGNARVASLIQPHRIFMITNARLVFLIKACDLSGSESSRGEPTP